MAALLHIGQIDTQARFAGDVADEPVIRRRLEDLATGPVAEGLADALAGSETAAGPITRIGDIAVKLALTRAELESAEAADLWMMAVLQAVSQAELDGEVWRFDNAPDYAAAYVHHRLGLSRIPAGVFSDFGTLDLLSPLRATAELCRATPALWAVLGRNPQVSPHRLTTALRDCNGEAGLAVLLQEPAQTASQAAGAATDIAHLVEVFATGIERVNWPDGSVWRAMGPQAKTVLAILLLSDMKDVQSVRIGRLAAVLLTLAQSRGHLHSAQLASGLQKLAAQQPVFAPFIKELLGMLKTDHAIAGRLVALMDRLAGSAATQPQHADREKRDPPKNTTDAAPIETGKTTDDAAQSSRGLVHLTAPFAGIGLVLPHLVEDGIGAAFPAQVRAQALAALVSNDALSVMPEHPFIAALCGTDAGPPDPSCVPDRPNAQDLLFVAATQQASVAAAAAGSAKLAAWLAARFASSLPGLTGSSLAFLQRQFVQMGGDLWIDQDTVTLRVDPMPLLPVLAMSGRLGLSDPPLLDWLNNRRFILRVDDGGAP